MSTPEFITNLRAKIGNDPLWLTGITAYVEDAQGRILLGKRADTGQWALIYGIVEPAEEPADTCVREALEETGVDIEPVCLVSVKSSPYMGHLRQRRPMPIHGPAVPLPTTRRRQCAAPRRR